MGSLSVEQVDALRPYIAGRVVTDLGSGIDLVLADQLLQIGAAGVVAVDPLVVLRQDGWDDPVDPRIKLRPQLFVDFADDIDVAFMSWPKMYAVDGLTEAAARSPTVIYLGKNAGGASCGSVSLFRHFARREVLAHVPDDKNTLIVYGGALAGPRELLAEERCAIDRRAIHRHARGG